MLRCALIQAVRANAPRRRPPRGSFGPYACHARVHACYLNAGTGFQFLFYEDRDCSSVSLTMELPLGECTPVRDELLGTQRGVYYKVTPKGDTPAPTAAPIAAPPSLSPSPSPSPSPPPDGTPAAPPSPSPQPPSPSPPPPSPPPPSPSLPPPSPPPDFSLVYTVALTDPATSNTTAEELQRATLDAVQETLTNGSSALVVVEISETTSLIVTLDAGTNPEAIEATRLQLKVQLCRGDSIETCTVIYDVLVSRRLADAAAGGTHGRRAQEEGDVRYILDRSYTDAAGVVAAANAAAVGAEVQGTETTALAAQATVTPAADSTASAEELEATDDVLAAVGASLGTEDLDVSAVAAYPPAPPPSPSPSPPSPPSPQSSSMSPPSPPPADASDDDDKSGGDDGGGGGGGGGGNVGAIAGGVAGGVAALLLIGGGYVWYTRKNAGGARVSLKTVKSEPKRKSSVVRMSVDRSSKPQSPEKEPAPYV